MPGAIMSNSTSIDVVIVGCGFAGLACAIESRRKGHKVVLLEKYQTLDILGDVISFAQNTGRIFERWGLGERLMAICTQHPTLHLHNHVGETLNIQPLPQKLFGFNSYNGRRGEIHEVLLDYAKKIGVEVRFGCKVVRYWEDGESCRSGVVVRDKAKGGEEYEFEGDVVVGADGVRSLARGLVLGYEDRPKYSGYAIYRAWFKAREQGVDVDPLTKHFYDNGGSFHGWVGKDVHMLAMSFHDGEDICWVITHRDTTDIPESYSLPGSIPSVLSVVDGWDPRCRAIVSKAPSCVDWKLVYRDPLPTRVSEGGRIVLIGDAAHPFLPSSGQGASQGVEDGVTLAVTLALSGKRDVPLATRTFEHIRYNRVRRAQAMGEKTRDKWHSAKYEKVDTNGQTDKLEQLGDENEDVRVESDEAEANNVSNALSTTSISSTCPKNAQVPSTSLARSTNGISGPSNPVTTPQPSRDRSHSSSSSSISSTEARTEPRSEPEPEAVKVELPFPEWLLSFDAEKHAYAVYDEVARGIVEQGYTRPVLEEA